MLVLSRRETERVRLGDKIVLTIVRVSGDKVRLGIEAPADVLVLRDELQPHGEVTGDDDSDAQEAAQRKAA
jgi:carbon storage regulator